MAETFDPTRQQFAVKGDIGPSVKANDLCRYAQSAFNRLGFLAVPLVVDGQYGPKTTNAVRQFQTMRKLPVNGLIGRWTWYELDWLAYDGWVPAPDTLTTHRPGCTGGCTAIVKGRNYHTGERVNSRGLTREAQRFADVVNHYAPVDYRKNFAVDRNARGSSRLSRHALGSANDDMTDLDRDKVLEDNEIAQCNMIADLMIARTSGWPTQYGDLNGERVAFIGPDRLATAVWGNHKINGEWWQKLTAGLLGRNDWSWTPPRKTWKRLSGNVHHTHLHFDTVGGAPGASN